jgi:hypothetical protein
MDHKEERKARIAAARKNRLKAGRNMFKQEVTVREINSGLFPPNLGYLKNPQNIPKPVFSNTAVSLNEFTADRLANDAYIKFVNINNRADSSYESKLNALNDLVSIKNFISVIPLDNRKQIKDYHIQLIRYMFNGNATKIEETENLWRGNSNPIVVSEYRNNIVGTTGDTEPTTQTLTNASNAVNRAKLVEKEVGAFPEGLDRVPEVPAPGASGCLGGSCWVWGGNIKKTRNRRKTKKNTRRRSTRRRR